MARSICYVTGQLGLGGAERQLFLLIRELVQRGHKITVISFNGQRGDYWEAPIQNLGVNVIAIPAGSGRLHRIAVVRRVLIENKVDTVHSWTFSANLYAAVCGRLAGVRVRLGSERSNEAGSKMALGNFWYSRSLTGLSALTANSEAAASYIRAFRPNLRVDVIRNGVDTALEMPLPAAERLRIRAELGVPSSALIVAGVGALIRTKNFGQLLNAASRLTADFPELVVVLVGDGSLRAELEAAARNLSPTTSTLFAGAVPDAGRMLGAFDVLCLPSIGFEGMPNVLLEAAAAGVPVVASSIGGAAEVVEDGVTGYLFPEGNTDTLTDRLSQLLQDAELRQRMGHAGRAKVRREFAVTTMVDAMERVYRQVGEGQ